MNRTPATDLSAVELSAPAFSGTEKRSAEKLSGVPETLLIPLYARAMETLRNDAIIHDPHAVALVDRIDYDFNKFADGHTTVLGIAIRTAIFDEFARAYIARHPDCLVINIAAGLDARYYRLDNGRLRWIELDLPESVELRRQFFSDTDRHRFLAANALDSAWLNDIERAPHTLIIIEGLLMYFDEADVRHLLGMLTDHFPGSELLVEVLGHSQAKRTDRSDMVSHTQAAFKWGIRQAAELGAWFSALDYVTDVSIYDRHAERWHDLSIAWPAPLATLRHTANRIVHLRTKA